MHHQECPHFNTQLYTGLRMPGDAAARFRTGSVWRTAPPPPLVVSGGQRPLRVASGGQRPYL